MPSKKQTDVSGGDRQPDETLTFCSLENLKVAQVQVVGGTLNGFSIGFVAVYAYFYLMSTDCSMYKKEVACNRVLNAECSWNKTRGECGWNGFTCFWGHGKDKTPCLDDSRCKWVYSDEECKNPTGYSSSYNGIFAGAMIVGAMIGSIYAGQFAARFGHKVSFLIVGIVGVVSSVMYHVSSATNEFWVLCVGRLLIGVVLGLVNVACPMYVDQNAHPKFLHVDGVLFQVFTTFGIMFAAAMGLAIGQSVNFDKDIKMDARMQGYCAFSTLLSVLMVALGIFLGESKTKFTSGKHEDDGTALDPNEYSYLQMLGPLAMGLVTSGTLQLTGINAVMNYAPKIMGNLGMVPLVGNFVVMAWNFVTTLVSIPLARVLTMRQLFLGASLVASVSCLLLCGVPVYPGVADKNVKNGVAITGLAVFIAAFEIGLGPCFFVLAQELFPRSFRPRGASFVLLTNFIFNVIINVCYPIATEGISGGPSGNQDKGQAVAFIFFGCIGLVCFVLQVFFLYPWEESTPQNHGDTNEESALPERQSPIEVATPGNRQPA
ncbi:glucose transporter,hexose transporter [Trypanosoma cruzi cruzi]|uniref:Putative hexose transporter n=1 Tax=Trypanosoma cruzi TaxID=5693 RepID=A0A2V2VMM0_TRYCR|nr:glucose transporter,hexose transporter [Trypanosoma cruzi cruzi]PWU97687.1 putative hexose transporter [Trypanosoma cruzi]